MSTYQIHDVPYLPWTRCRYRGVMTRFCAENDGQPLNAK
jgi:hypothetical protein